ncbi:Taurine-transporting ATPase [Syntrophobotulus glycolicus DSM 8271]|uniref:Taurine-transporting ATPase n=1 Tax=Syntrophobotulus glycolicus (strain DSM 8271 / FlGlyR) TaxID=645991 RepID=F0T193_SYNGF|nr:ABC transporter ATP-binding protein [Syntrophobotulus glycolicus]ADY55157.1 Taurine-transporting ATPase [Syntrophobotulus glycolicus DSM 8271]
MFWKKKNVARGNNTVIEVRVASSKIVVDNLRKAYGSKEKQTTAIDNVSIEILDNEFVSIVGPSGCGKSTLLRILAGLDEATGGTATVDDTLIDRPGADRGMVFQSYTLFPWLTVEENIQFGLKIKGIPKKQANEIVDRYLDIIKLKPFRKSYPKELSGGMKQRVAIARALANSPKVLLMDEPFGALDSQTKSEMQLLMRQIWQVEKPTVVFITHDIEEAVFLSTRIYVMSGRPSGIKANIPIYLPYRRSISLKETMEFMGYRHKLTALLQEKEESIGLE